MKKRHVSYLMIYLILATITLTASVFAWFQLSKNSSGFIDTNITDFTAMITFEVKRENDENYIEIKTIDDMHEVFGDTRPGEYYQFRLIIENDYETAFTINTYIPRVETKVADSEYSSLLDTYSMLDVFYLNERTVYTKIDENVVEHEIDLNGTTDSFNENSLNKLINNNTIYLLESFTIPAGKSVEISFTLTYDRETTNTNYQNLMLSLGGIYVYAEQEKGS